MKKIFLLFNSIIFLITSLSIYSQIKDTQPPVPYIKKTECCGQPVGISYVIDEPRSNPSIRSNISSIEFIREKSFNFNFYHDQFIPGVADSVAFTLKIIDEKYDATAVIKFSDMAGNDTTIEVEYYAIKLQPLMPNLNFGNVPINTSKSLIASLWNYSQRDFILNYISLDSLQTNVHQKGDFSIELINTDSVIQQFYSINIRVTYKPTKIGFSDGYIVVADKCNFREALFTLQGYSSANDISFNDKNIDFVYVEGDYIQLNCKGEQEQGSVEIYDVFGSSVYLGDLINKKVNISTLSAGIYFLRLNNTVSKIIKQN